MTIFFISNQKILYQNHFVLFVWLKRVCFLLLLFGCGKESKMEKKNNFLEKKVYTVIKDEKIDTQIGRITLRLNIEYIPELRLLNNVDVTGYEDVEIVENNLSSNEFEELFKNTTNRSTSFLETNPNEASAFKEQILLIVILQDAYKFLSINNSLLSSRHFPFYLMANYSSRIDCRD